jgi:hypothetical protein
MDAMLNEALGMGRVSPLMDKMPGINEPFLNCLHALTHGNPNSVRMTTFGLDKIFNTEGLLAKVELELGIFVLYRRTLGEDINTIWKMLATILDRPSDVQANVLIAAHPLRQSGKAAPSLGCQRP